MDRNHHIENGMGVVLLGLKVDLIVCAAAVALAAASSSAAALACFSAEDRLNGFLK